MSRTTELTSLSTHPGGAGWALLRQALGWPMRVHRARQTMHALGRLGDHELRDIGLTRLDLSAVSALPLDADPSPTLRRRADERRRRR
ncbi:DUF1127 domain-containing protein [Lichenibacterium dinghuense]|uniref:DUF1127 domain-containing protein n=1 Tax=Lichenibacterium dinghuense TaxID=2895977 RepID=UPI001F286ED6|nr:DUF1127 domain-containing protein [Lichenibacterium sp. 6Y81]